VRLSLLKERNTVQGALNFLSSEEKKTEFLRLKANSLCFYKKENTENVSFIYEAIQQKMAVYFKNNEKKKKAGRFT